MNAKLEKLWSRATGRKMIVWYASKVFLFGFFVLFLLGNIADTTLTTAFDSWLMFSSAVLGIGLGEKLGERKWPQRSSQE